MATEVYTTEEITLQDGTDVEIRPLPIAKLRKFTKLWNGHMQYVAKVLKEAQESENEEDLMNSDELTDRQYDVWIKMCALGLERQLKDTMTEKQFLAYLEDTLDEKTIYKILEVTGNLHFGQGETPNPTPPENLAGVGKN